MKAITTMTSIRKHTLAAAMLVTTMLSLLLPGATTSDTRVQFSSGYVAAVGVVMDEQGHPMLAEYDSDGKFVADVGYLGIGPLENVVIYPAASWRAFQEFQLELERANPEASKKWQKLSAEQYQSRSFKTRGSERKDVGKPDLLPDTKSVLVIGEDQMLNPEPPKQGFILAEYPIALFSNPGIADDDVSLILNQQGEVVRRSKFDISYKVGVYKEDAERGEKDGNKLLWKPLSAILVSTGPPDLPVYPGGIGTSRADGRYSMTYALPPCPGFAYEHRVPVVATLDVENFNPKAEDFGFFTSMQYDYKWCVGYGDVSLGPSLLAQLTRLNAQAIVATLATPIYDLNVIFSSMQLSAVGTLTNEVVEDFAPLDGQTLEPVEFKASGQTVYVEDASVEQLAESDYRFDFNLDGEDDIAVINKNDSNLVDIYISPNKPENEAGEEVPPDFTRRADYLLESQLRHQGLLSEINQTDLEDTDIYIYRKTTGQRLGAIEGLVKPTDGGAPAGDGPVNTRGNEKGRLTYRGVHTDEDFATFGFTSFLVGAVSGDTFSNTRSSLSADPARRRPWQTSEDKATNFGNDNLPDGLRPGETIQVIAINRATGYIGTQDIILQPSGTTLEPPEPIRMGPPNLKIVATRKFDDFNEVTKKGDTRTNIIGSEGAGLTSDQLVSIQTIWLDEKGGALPDDLPGYTGRVVKSTSSSSTGDFSANFKILPGYNTQVVQLNNGSEPQREHLYVQVVGEPFEGTPGKYFGSPSKSEGRLQTRPGNYVPILVPLFDEESTRIAEDALALARLEGIENLPERADPTYRWVYRPEMQFSIYELKKQELKFEDSLGVLQEFDLSRSDSSSPLVVLNNDIDFVDLLYDAIGSESDPLPYFGPEKELVFALGAEEALATITEDGTVKFEDLDHIVSLTSDDFLSIRLYANNDSANTLWEYNFEYIYVETTVIGYENQTDDVYYVTADEPVVELKAGIAGYAYRDEEDKYDGNMKWVATGAGSFNEQSQRVNEFGLFDNTLVMPTTKGAKSDVSIIWQEAGSNNSDQTVGWKTVEVLAGAVTRIEVSQTGAAIALEQGDVRLDYTLYDAYGNLVEDGTEIELDFADSLILKEQELSTTDGKAYAVFSGGEFVVNNTVITVSSGGVSEPVDVSVAALNLDIEAGQTALNKTESTIVTATVTRLDGSPVAGVPVVFSATQGLFAEQALISNSAGQVSSRFTAGLNEIQDTWNAQVGYIASADLDYTVVSRGPQSINTQDTVLVGDAAVDGVVNFDGYGVDIEIGYETAGTVAVRGNVGDTVSIGDMADPNLEPIISLPLNDKVFTGLQGRFEDDHGVNPAYINRGHSVNLDDEITIVRDHPLGAGYSAYLKAESRLTIEANDLIEIADNSGFRLDIKPIGDGNVLSFDKDGFRLSYAGDTLTLRIATDQGTFSVVANNVAANEWYSVAGNVRGNQLSLYVDGTVYSQTISGSPIQGNPLIIDSKVIQIGGLEAVIRGFRTYDYASQPLIAFADDSTTTTLQAEAETLTIKSLGNLGTLVPDSQLSGVRIALIGEGERNYASVLSQKGYQDIALAYLYSVSPQVPEAGTVLGNPLPGLVATAHAWSWSGVWDGIKSTVAFIIPYEDFIVIAEQLSYLINQDWENFDPVALAFASLGAATILPIAKPLIPLLRPLKKVVDGMRRFPAARHFAGVIGTAVKAAVSGRTEKIVNLLPFILIAVELFNDKTVFEFIMNAIESEDDLWVWVDFIAEIVSLEGGLAELAYSTGSANGPVRYVANPFPGFISNTHAASPRQDIARLVIRSLSKTAGKITNPKDLTNALRPTLRELKDPNNAIWKQLIRSGTL